MALISGSHQCQCSSLEDQVGRRDRASSQPPSGKLQLSNYFTAGCKCSKPPFSWARPTDGAFPTEECGEEKKASPEQYSLQSEHRPSREARAQQGALAGLLGQVTGEQGTLPISPHQLERRATQPKGQVPSIPQNTNGAPQSSFMQNLFSVPSDSLTGASYRFQLQEVSVNGQTSSFSIIKFTDPVT